MSRSLEDFTEDELLAWEERHDNLIAWGSMWSALSTIFLVTSLVLVLIVDQATAGLWIVCLSLTCQLAKLVCDKKHFGMHEERGDFDRWVE